MVLGWAIKDVAHTIFVVVFDVLNPTGWEIAVYLVYALIVTVVGLICLLLAFRGYMRHILRHEALHGPPSAHDTASLILSPTPASSAAPSAERDVGAVDALGPKPAGAGGRALSRQASVVEPQPVTRAQAILDTI